MCEIVTLSRERLGTVACYMAAVMGKKQLNLKRDETDNGDCA